MTVGPLFFWRCIMHPSLGEQLMISSVRIVRFKRFEDQTFDLIGGSVLLAGPNNSGKTTLLHAISAWNLALKRWVGERGDAGGQKRISIVLDEFTALPLREMNLLWTNRHTARRASERKQPKPAPIYVQVKVKLGERVEDSLTIEFMYANEKLVYVRPVKNPDDPSPISSLPPFARSIEVVHVPPFSGIGTQEPRHATGIQNKLVGEGRAGEIVRNLLLEIWQKPQADGQSSWQELVNEIDHLFKYKLLTPQFSENQPYIVCEYQPPASGRRAPRLDIANAGSGFHQVLLLLSFFYARPSSVLLLDEPDAHLHFILQREIFDVLKGVARKRNCKLIIATHAEVLLAGSEPDQIISFIGACPRRLLNPGEKQRLQEALRRLSALDLLQADQVQAVLYVEDESDYKFLREWSRVLSHPASRFLDFPYVVPLGGKGHFDEAKRHFQCLTLARPGLQGLCISDRDQDSTEPPPMPAGLASFRWSRYEIENYALNPEVVKRFLTRETDLFSEAKATEDRTVVDTEFSRSFPAGVDYLADIPTLRDLKASEFLEEVLSKTSSPLPKRELYVLATFMKPEEIHRDVIRALDSLEGVLPATSPNIEINRTPPDPNGVASEAQEE